jgi:hypothetical protein
MNSRYLQTIDDLAHKTSGNLHRAFETALLQKFSEKAKGENPESQAIAGYLARWRRRAKISAWACTGAGAIALGIASYSTESLERLILAHLAIGGAVIASQQRRSAEEIAPVLGVMARLQAYNSVLPLVQVMGGGQNPGGAVPTQVIALPNSPPVAATPQFFDWDELKDGDRYPHILVIGPTGGGKTYSTERILKHLGTPIRVITTKRKAHQWKGLEVIGHPRNFEAIGEAFLDSLDEMQSRLELIDKDWPQLWTVVDELPAIVANVPNTTEFLTTFIREARETRLRFCFLVQGQQVKTIGLEGQSDLRDNLLEIRLGKFAIKEAEAIAKKSKSPQAEANLLWLKEQKYPLLVGDLPGKLP